MTTEVRCSYRYAKHSTKTGPQTNTERENEQQTPTGAAVMPTIMRANVAKICADLELGSFFDVVCPYCGGTFGVLATNHTLVR